MPERDLQLLPYLDTLTNQHLKKRDANDKTKEWMLFPQLGESASEGTIIAWLKQPGDRVEKYEPIAEVETDKVTTEIRSPIPGIFRDFAVEAGTTMRVGANLCLIEKDDILIIEDKQRDEKIEASDKEKKGIVANPIQHTAPRLPEALGIDTQRPETEPQRYIPVFPGDEIIPHTSMRRAIAEHMVRSERTAPHVTAVMETDMTNVVAYRNEQKKAFEKREGINLTYLPFAIKAATLALRDHPRLNAVFDEDRIIHRKAVNIGIAVALEDGLIVPVIKNADRLSIAGLAHASTELVDKARSGRLTPDDVSGGTFTVNNPGVFGSIMSTPILVQPQVAILSTEAIIKRPAVVDNAIAIRDMMNLSLSFDHRALDGLAAARFLQQVKKLLENVNDKTPLY